MHKTTQHWVEFLSPGFITGETREIKIDHSDASAVKWPQDAYAFRLYRQPIIDDGVEVYRAEKRQIGPLWYHPDSKIETLDQVKKRPGESILINNMEGNNWPQIIWTRWGNWPQPYDPETTKIMPS